MPPALFPFWLIRVVWCPLAGPVVALCVPRPCVMKMFHAPVERSTVDPSRPMPRSKTAPVKIRKRCRNSPERSSFEPDRAASVLADSRGLVSSRGSCCCAVCASSLRHENVPCPGGAQHRRSVLSRASKQNCTGQNQKTVQKWCRNGAVLNPTAEIHFTEGSQGNSCVGVNGFTKLKWYSAVIGGVGEGPHASPGHPGGMPEGSRGVEERRARRYPPVRAQPLLHPGGMPDFPHRTPVLAPRRGATSHHA